MGGRPLVARAAFEAPLPSGGRQGPIGDKPPKTAAQPSRPTPLQGEEGGVRELAMMAMRSLPQPFVEPGAGDGTGSTEVGWEFASAGAKRADPPTGGDRRCRPPSGVCASRGTRSPWRRRLTAVRQSWSEPQGAPLVGAPRPLQVGRAAAPIRTSKKKLFQLL